MWVLQTRGVLSLMQQVKAIGFIDVYVYRCDVDVCDVS